MAEVSICARPEDGSRVQNKTQKRPLSIIREFDVDDIADIAFTKYCEDAGDSSRGNISVYNEPQDSERDDKHILDIQVASELNRIVEATSMQHKKGSTVPTCEYNSHQTTMPLPKCTPKSRILHQNCENSASEPPAQDSKAGLNDLFVLEQWDEKIPSRLFPNSENCDRKLVSCSEADSHSWKTVQNEGSVSCELPQKNEKTVSRINSDCPVMRTNQDCPSSAKFQEDSLHNLPAVSPPQLPAALSPKLDHLPRFQISPARILQDRQSNPQVTVTSIDAVSRLASHTSLPPTTDFVDIMRNNNSNSSSSKFLMDLHSSSSSSSSNLSSSFTNRICPSPILRRSTQSPRLPRRRSTESLGSVSDGDVSEGNGGVLNSPEHLPPPFLSDFRRLKETTERLRLSTRRPSTLLWKQKYIENQDLPGVRSNQSSDVTDELLTSDRRQRIDEVLELLRNELQEMRCQDQILARQLLTIRNDIHQLKLQRSTEQHQELIEDFQSEVEDLQEFSDILDMPQPEFGVNPLKHIGVTRLNISARRFSAC